MKVDPEPFLKPGVKPPRPRDAATLIIYRKREGHTEVLMGRRHHKHKFLPKRFVFPGGAVERMDSRVRPATTIRLDVERLLLRRAKAPRIRGIVAAAIRETFEESGLIVGKPDPDPSGPVPKNWQDFFATGMAPAFGDIDYIARAVTPPWRPIRFNARFFTVNAENVSGNLASNGELLDLTFFRLCDIHKLELALITTRVLELLDGHAKKSIRNKTNERIVLFKHNGKYHDMIFE